MNKEELGYFIRDYIKNNLTISINEYTESYVGDGIEVKVILHGEEISSSHIITEYRRDVGWWRNIKIAKKFLIILD